MAKPARRQSVPAALVSFGSMLVSFRKGARLPQSALAVRSGLHCSYLSRLENGQREPSFETLETLCAALELDDFDADALFLAAGRVRSPQASAYLLDQEARPIGALLIGPLLSDLGKQALRRDLMVITEVYTEKGDRSHDRAA